MLINKIKIAMLFCVLFIMLITGGCGNSEEKSASEEKSTLGTLFEEKATNEEYEGAVKNYLETVLHLDKDSLKNNTYSINEGEGKKSFRQFIFYGKDMESQKNILWNAVAHDLKDMFHLPYKIPVEEDAKEILTMYLALQQKAPYTISIEDFKDGKMITINLQAIDKVKMREELDKAIPANMRDIESWALDVNEHPELKKAMELEAHDKIIRDNKKAGCKFLRDAYAKTLANPTYVTKEIKVYMTLQKYTDEVKEKMKNSDAKGVFIVNMNVGNPEGFAHITKSFWNGYWN